MNISIKQCSIQDLDVLRAFSIKTYYQTFARHNPPEIMTAYLQDAFNEQKLCAELGNPNSTFYFLYQGEEIVGYLKVNETPAQTDINDKESLEKFTGDSFRDLTRIARINDLMWSELFVANKDVLLEQMNMFMDKFNDLKRLLEAEDVDGMREMMRHSTRRRALFDKK
jgi:hypothetical protein